MLKQLHPSIPAYLSCM
uniref:Uncharacterized protein n=1 Tax=Anguilla anguilla TaxID=7936 RepID=A0A0E9P553_ANGAN